MAREATTNAYKVDAKCAQGPILLLGRDAIITVDSNSTGKKISRIAHVKSAHRYVQIKVLITGFSRV